MDNIRALVRLYHLPYHLILKFVKPSLRKFKEGTISEDECMWEIWTKISPWTTIQE